MLHPRDWEMTDSKKRKGRLTVKTPKWASDTIKEFRTLKKLCGPVKDEKRILSTMEKELQDIEAR